MNVSNVGVGRVGVCMLCVSDIEECECGVGVGVNATMLSETLYPMNLCVCDHE